MDRTVRFVRWCGVAALTLLLFPIIGLMRDEPTLSMLAVTLPALVVFAVVFAWVWVRAATASPSATELKGVIALAALATALNLAYPDQIRWLSLFVFVVAAAGFAVSGRIGLVVMGLTVLVAVGTALAIPEVRERLAPSLPLGEAAALPQLLLIGLGAAGVRRLIDTTEALRAAREQLARLAVEKERHRFARDLHDLLGHSLSMITLKSELAGRLLPDRPADAAIEIGEIERIARSGLKEVREAVSGYRRATLASELAAVQAVLEAAGIECRVEDAVGILPTEVEEVFAWAIREGGTNVARHSRARRCTICLRRDVDSASLEIVDDGMGGVESAGSGYGLAGLRERVTAAGGRMESGLLPAPTRGFRLSVALPVPAQETSFVAASMKELR